MAKPLIWRKLNEFIFNNKADVLGRQTSLADLGSLKEISNGSGNFVVLFLKAKKVVVFPRAQTSEVVHV